MNNPVVLIGCGAQARFVLEIFRRTGPAVSRVFDPIGGKVGERLDKYLIEDFDGFSKLHERGATEPALSAIICVNDQKMKKRLFTQLEKSTEIINAIHPSAAVAMSAKLGRGIIMNPQADLEVDCQIGNGCMLHAKSHVGHDNVIGDFAVIGASAVCCGSVRIGENTIIYTGSLISPGVTVGENSIIGAGSLVLDDIPSNVLAYGNPARIIREIDESEAEADSPEHGPIQGSPPAVPGGA